MNYIEILYKVSDNKNIDLITNEIEYGTTFLLGKNEKIIPVPNNGNKWIAYDYNQGELKLFVNPEFLQNSFFFEKFMTAFLYNLIEFGPMYLIDIKISDLVINHIDRLDNREIFNTFPVFGTIFKPYYHQSVKDKISFAQKYVEFGGSIIKEDETYFVTQEYLLYESSLLQAAISPDGVYIPNITSYVNDFLFIRKLMEIDIKVVLVNFLVTGFQPLIRIKQQFPSLKIWGHRVGYESLKNYISMNALGVLAVLAGVDYLHIGTELDITIKKKQLSFISKAIGINPNFIPIFSKLTPELSRDIVDYFGKNSIHLMCGYIRDQKTGKISWEKLSK
jgi:hypothetical protein